MSVISFEILFCLLLEGQLATKSLKNWAEGQLATFGFLLGTCVESYRAHYNIGKNYLVETGVML